MRVLFFSEDYDVDLHCGSSSNGVGFYVEGRGVVFYSQTDKKIVFNKDPEFWENLQRLFEQTEIIEGEDILGKVTWKALEIREIKTLADEEVLRLLERVKDFIKERESLTAQILAFFPKQKT